MAGVVYLVGAGPGDPGLITVRGLGLLESADVVVHDRLVDARLLRRARVDAEMVDAGKTPGGKGARQDDIHALLIAKASEGRSVVRLKGGDPFVFGRGGEEAMALSRAGIPFEVVPGITSAIAAPAYAGIPVTHRGVASSVTVVTGSESPDKPATGVDWSALARTRGTLVVLMGWRSLESVVARLRAEGLPDTTPAALVEWGTGQRQRTVAGTLADVVEKGRACGLGPPVVAVFGDVAALRGDIRWFDNRPLFGKRVLVTRSRAQASALTRLLEGRGAEVVEVPTIRIEPPEDYCEIDEALRRLPGFDWVVFTSTNAVDAVFGRLREAGLDSRALHGTRVAAIGQSTARSLRDVGIAADLVASLSIAEGLVKEMAALGVAGSHILVPGAETRREALASGLAELGAEVEVVAAYRTVNVEGSPAAVEAALANGIDVATFTSSSTVRGLVRLLGGDVRKLDGVDIACIGPVTAAEVRSAGLDVAILAQESTVEGLVDAITDYYGGGRPNGQIPDD